MSSFRRLANSDHPAAIAYTEHEIARLSHMLGLDRPSGGENGR
jgi:hypothetical protein